MSRVSTYLNFRGTTEEAFAFYASVFGTEFSVPIMRMGDMPPPPGAPRCPNTNWPRSCTSNCRSSAATC